MSCLSKAWQCFYFNQLTAKSFRWNFHQLEVVPHSRDPQLQISENYSDVFIYSVATLYASQTSRVKWGSSFSETFSISNGVKQCGVLSPILFVVYNNSWLDELEKSRAGCYDGRIFMGAFGYVDDIILLAPCKKSLCVLLDICKFSLEFQVNFNSSKSKLIVFSNANDCDTSVFFNNQMISSVSSGQHIGHIIGNQVSQEGIKTLSGLNLPLSSSSTTSRELLSQFSTCSGWRWFDVVQIL